MAAEAATRDPSLGGQLALAGTGMVLGLLLLLHVVKPELDPSWRFLSEYAIGPHGWIMRLAFQVWALTCFLLFAVLKRELTSPAGWVGNYVLLIVGLALSVAGWFAQDPVTARPEELTMAGNIHALASMIGVPGTPLAALLISRSLSGNPVWAPRRALLMTSAHLTWTSLLLMALYLGWKVPQAGGFTPEVWAGWLNRLVVATYLLWQAVTAYLLLGINRSRAAG
jgi:hypothetical protein